LAQIAVRADGNRRPRGTDRLAMSSSKFSRGAARFKVSRESSLGFFIIS